MELEYSWAATSKNKKQANFGHKRPAVAGPLDGLVSRAPIRAQPLPIYL